jgi:acyl-[acyl carrier protein]--UDP-N-acetylglucosamine O-acyltransferase
MSVLDFLHLGSSLSLRSFARVSSSVSVRGLSNFGSSMSVLDFLHLGSSLSLRSFARVGSSVSLNGLSRFGSVFSMSVLDLVHLGSSLSLRSFVRVGSSISLSGLSRFGSVFSMSVLDFVHLGSSLSLRSFARVGSSVSVLDFLHLGSSLSLRSFAHVGSSISIGGTLQFGAADTYMRYNSGVELRVGGNRALVGTSTGGTLHGAWTSETTISTSDRRLKDNIDDLAGALPGLVGKAIGERGDPVAWVLGELRPVSYHFKSGVEAKMRMGFLADEMERVLPHSVRFLEGESGLQGIIYQDLIALLVAASQNHQEQIRAVNQRVAALEGGLESLAARIERDLGGISAKVASLERWRETYRRSD